MSRLFIILGSLNCLLAVALGAFGAHGLKNILSLQALLLYNWGMFVCSPKSFNNLIILLATFSIEYCMQGLAASTVSSRAISNCHLKPHSYTILSLNHKPYSAKTTLSRSNAFFKHAAARI